MWLHSRSAAGQRLVDWRLEAAHVFHRHVLAVARLQVLVQDGKDLVVEHLEFTDSVHHLLQRLQVMREGSTSKVSYHFEMVQHHNTKEFPDT